MECGIMVGVGGKPHQAVILKLILQAGDATLKTAGQDARGWIGDKRISVPAAVFDQPTIDAAMKYRFTPAIMNGRPVAVWVVIPFTFKLHPEVEKKSGDSPRIEKTGLSMQRMNSHPEAERLTELMSQYNMGMYHERMKEYPEAIENYELFLRGAEDAKTNLIEMVRHAKEFVQAHSKTLKKQK